MMNIIRGDIYRILRGKGLYITLVVVLLLNVLILGPRLSVGINFGTTHEDLGAEMPSVYIDGIAAADILFTNMNNIVFFMLPIITIAATAIFTNKTVKNDISFGVSRTKLYMSKLLLSGALCAVLVIFYIATGMLIATIAHGFGGPVPAGFWLNMVQTVGAQLIALLGVTSMGIFMVFTFKRSSAVVGAYIAFWLVPVMLIMLLASVIDPRILRMLDFDLMFALDHLGFFSQLETRTILTALGAGVFYMLVPTIGGIALFSRAEIK
ncbi:MAG: ABC transporter permease [Defluviitaleaceae bacterium]|nr:ABC transporter permease [Defluviitaleaceae bacterium]